MSSSILLLLLSLLLLLFHHHHLLLMTHDLGAGVLWDGALFLELLLQRSLEGARLARGARQNCPCYCLFFFWPRVKNCPCYRFFIYLVGFATRREIVLGTVSVPPSPFPLPPSLYHPPLRLHSSRASSCWYLVRLSLIYTLCVCACVQGLGFWVLGLGCLGFRV